MIKEKDQGRSYPDRKERYRLGSFYNNLIDIVDRVGKPELSMFDFNVFCCQTDVSLKALVSSQQAGFLSLASVAKYFQVDEKTAYRMIPTGELVVIKVGGQYRIPGAAVLLQADVGLWHHTENDREKRLRAMKQGDLSVLQADGEIPSRWMAYVASGLGTIPDECRWHELVESNL